MTPSRRRAAFTLLLVLLTGLATARTAVQTATVSAPPLLERLTGIRLNHVAYRNQPEVITDLTPEEKKLHDFGTYTEEQYFDDMGRITEYRTDPDMCELLVTRSKETMRWMQKKGIRFIPIYGTIWILIFAYSYRVSVSYRVSFSAVLQIGPELEESAAVSGASRMPAKADTAAESPQMSMLMRRTGMPM